MTNQLHLLITFFLGCTQRECKPNEVLIEDYIQRCSNHVLLLEQLKNYEGVKSLTQKTAEWSYDMEGHARKCVERDNELANKEVEQLYKVSNACLDDHQFKQEEPESVGGLSQVCPQIVLQCLYLARIGRPHILCRSTKLQEQSQNGLRHAADDWQN